MSDRPRTIRIGDLIGSAVVTADGEHVGRVEDIAVTRGPRFEVTALDLGTAGWLDRMGIDRVFGLGRHRQRKPHRIPWSNVAAFDGSTVTLKPSREQRPQPAAS
jgi:hypothetical protein